MNTEQGLFLFILIKRLYIYNCNDSRCMLHPINVILNGAKRSEESLFYSVLIMRFTLDGHLRLHLRAQNDNYDRHSELLHIIYIKTMKYLFSKSLQIN